MNTTKYIPRYKSDISLLTSGTSTILKDKKYSSLQKGISKIAEQAEIYRRENKSYKTLKKALIPANKVEGYNTRERNI